MEVIGVTTLAITAAAGAAAGASEPASFQLPRAESPLQLERGLEDGAWPGALRLERFYETFPGDGLTPPVDTLAFLIRDAEALLVAVHARDPEPAGIRAPLVDRDQVFSDQDFVQIEIDPVGRGRSSRLFRVNPRGVQGDGIFDESTGVDDFSPDFPFESLVRRAASGWRAAVRIPLSSLPAPASSSLAWRVVIFRNYPRSQVHQMASNRIPRGAGCWLCFASRLEGAAWQPRHALSLTPYATSTRAADALAGGPQLDGGADLRWSTPGGVTLDATLWPDFSQIESDLPRIEANARFALTHPERRPFFMAGRELLATPIPAVHTRSIAAPAWGLRATGPSFAVLLARDDGGGLAVVPGPTSSARVLQDTASQVALGRYRRPLGAGLTPGLLVTSRETAGGGSNTVLGPDLDWRPSPSDHVQAQLLFSRSELPQRPDLHPEWDGRRLDSHASSLAWTHSAAGLNASLGMQDVGPGFRADTGFVPQVGVRRWSAAVGYALYPGGWLTLVRPGLRGARATGSATGDVVERTTAPELAFQGRRGLSAALAYHVREQTRVGERLLEASFLSFDVALQPGRRVPRLSIGGRLGEALDVAEARVGRGGTMRVDVALRPEERLGLDLHAEWEWLDTPQGEPALQARVLRAKATWAPDVRRFVRLIGQHARLRLGRDRQLGAGDAADRLEWSLLVGLRFGWRTVAFAGYSGASEGGSSSRQLFFKLAYELHR